MSLVWIFGRTPWPGEQPNARPLPKQDNTTHIHASRRIRNRDPSVRAVEDSTCLKPRDHWDRRLLLKFEGDKYEPKASLIISSDKIITQ